jgi:dipeptidyl aminopeptidase/acylaminoacyl peptidase
MKKMSLGLAFAAASTVAGAPQPPANTELFLVPAAAIFSGDAAPAAALNISNNPGYDNQPGFTPDGRAVIFSSNRDGKQTDIYRYDLETNALTQLTKTAESEYSPLVTPDGRTFSTVRVEADGTQRLWRFDLADGGNPRLVLEQIKPVGYHAWIDATHLALFVLGAQGSPATLQLADMATGAAEVIDSRIGRSLHVRPATGTVSYIGQPQGARALVKEFDPKTKQTRTITELPDGVTGQDCAWLADGTLLLSSGSTIWSWRSSGGWREAVRDASTMGMQRLTRIAVGPSRGSASPWLAIVAEPAAR